MRSLNIDIMEIQHKHFFVINVLWISEIQGCKSSPRLFRGDWSKHNQKGYN